MQSTFDFDKVFDEIVCEKEAEINRLKKFVEKIETLKNAKDTFISTMANIIQSNNSFPRDGKPWQLGRLWIIKKINKIIDFIELFHTSWMLNVAKSLRDELITIISDEDILMFERWSHQYPNLVTHVANTINYRVKTFNTHNEMSGYDSVGDAGRATKVFDLGDILSELWSQGSNDASQDIGIVGGPNTLRILNQILRAIHDYLDAIIKDME